MENGTIELVVRYKVASSDPFTSGYFSRDDVPFSYAVATESNNKKAIPNNSYVDLTFDMPGGIPLYATDVYFYVLYRGTLTEGNSVEENAVAVGFKDVSEPTPFAFLNNTDKVCINNTWYDSGSDEVLALAGQNGWDAYPHALSGFDVRFYTYGTPDVYPPPADFSVAPLYPRSFDQVFVIGDGTSTMASAWDRGYIGYGTSTIQIIPLTQGDNFSHGYYAPLARPQRPNIRRQKTAYTDPAACQSYGFEAPCTLDWWPQFITLRGNQFWGPEYYNSWYPANGSPCDINGLQQ